MRSVLTLLGPALPGRATPGRPDFGAPQPVSRKARQAAKAIAALIGRKLDKEARRLDEALEPADQALDRIKSRTARMADAAGGHLPPSADQGRCETVDKSASKIGMAGKTTATPFAVTTAVAEVSGPGEDSVTFGADGLAALAGGWLDGDLGSLAPAALHALARRLDGHWAINARPAQMPPKGSDWRTWLLLGGRGSGKTRAGAEWVQAIATSGPPVRIALIGETLGDVREVMIDGLSGIFRIAGQKRPEFEITRRRLVWPNGSLAQIFSAEDPESLRGPQFDYAWCDELGKWNHAAETWDMLQFGLRLGTRPRQLVTTTPRPIPLLKTIIADPQTRIGRLATADNEANLAPGFIAAIQARYGGTRLGRQELDGELIAEREDALWSRDQLERLRIAKPEPMRRIVVAVDPPASDRAEGSCCGIVVAGLDLAGRGVVLADCSLEKASPSTWGRAVVKAYQRFAADRVIAEVNQGGDMVSAILRSVDAALPITCVHAARGKLTRAEPVAALYEQGRVVHCGSFAALEDQMCDFGPDGLSSGRSPDRLDALVWALTALMLTSAGEPRVRGI